MIVSFRVTPKDTPLTLPTSSINPFLQLSFRCIASGVTYEQGQAMKEIRDFGKEQCKGLEVLGEYAWLLKLEIHLPILCRLVSIAESADISYKIAYLDNELR